MNFTKIKCRHAFYDDYYSEIYYVFDTVPVIGHGEWAISRGGDSAYDLRNDRVTQTDFPDELLSLLEFVPDDIDIEGLEE